VVVVFLETTLVVGREVKLYQWRYFELAMITMQVICRCKRIIMPPRSLDTDVDKNLVLKFFHHYFTKLYKNLLIVSTVRSISIHRVRLYVCIACLHSSFYAFELLSDRES
jgi:hypothetical protein